MIVVRPLEIVSYHGSLQQLSSSAVLKLLQPEAQVWVHCFLYFLAFWGLLMWDCSVAKLCCIDNLCCSDLSLFNLQIFRKITSKQKNLHTEVSQQNKGKVLFGVYGKKEWAYVAGGEVLMGFQCSGSCSMLFGVSSTADLWRQSEGSWWGRVKGELTLRCGWAGFWGCFICLLLSLGFEGEYLENASHLFTSAPIEMYPQLTLHLSGSNVKPVLQISAFLVTSHELCDIALFPLKSGGTTLDSRSGKVVLVCCSLLDLSYSFCCSERLWGRCYCSSPAY